MKTQSFLISGAGTGIGKATALKIAQAYPGSRIFLLGRNQNRLESVRVELPHPEKHTVLVADLRDRSELRRVLRSVSFENLVGVVANAGVGGENRYGENDRWDEVIETNLTGTYTLVQECLPALRSANQEVRSVVVVSSILARLGVPGYTAYCASKAGLLGLTRSWAAQYAKDKILFNAICPGWVDTEMSTQGLQAMAAHGRRSFEDTRKSEMEKVPLGKMSRPEEIAELVTFLLGGTQTSITGQTLDINNGAIMP